MAGKSTKSSASNVYLKELIKAEVKRRLNEEDAVPEDPAVEQELEKALEDGAKKLAADMSKVGTEVETKLKSQEEVEQVLKQNPDIQKLANESRKMSGKTLQEREALNEEIFSVTFLVGLTLAIPSVVSLIGSIVKVIESKLGSKTEMGDKLKHIGHEMHEGIIKFITNGLKLIPGFAKLKPDTQRKIATVVHIIIVSYLAIHSGGVAIESVKSGMEAANISKAMIEGALSAVKAGEVSSFLKSAILSVLGK